MGPAELACAGTLGAFRLPPVVMLMRNVTCSLRHLNTQSPGGGTVWGSFCM